MKIIFLGSQGSGKSTQAEILAKRLGLPYIEMGQLFRERAKDKDTEAVAIGQAIEAGNLVSDEIATATLHWRLAKKDCQGGFVLDGYPRTFSQLEGLPPGIDKVFYIKVSDEKVMKRLIGRGRDDDSLEVISRRLQVYYTETEPLLSYFKEKGILEEVDGERSIEVIAQDVAHRLESQK